MYIFYLDSFILWNKHSFSFFSLKFTDGTSLNVYLCLISELCNQMKRLKGCKTYKHEWTTKFNIGSKGSSMIWKVSPSLQESFSGVSFGEAVSN